MAVAITNISQKAFPELVTTIASWLDTGVTVLALVKVFIDLFGAYKQCKKRKKREADDTSQRQSAGNAQQASATDSSSQHLLGADGAAADDSADDGGNDLPVFVFFSLAPYWCWEACANFTFALGPTHR